MAYEVAVELPYGLPADVYAFGAILYEIWSLRKIYEHLSYKAHARDTYRLKKRPEIKHSWPSSVRDLLKSCWAHEPCSRPSFPLIHEKLLSVPEEITKRKLSCRS